MSKLNILIVEDEFLVGADIEESLLSLGYEVQNCVSSGLAAIAEVEKKLPDIILMDINLKGDMSGIEAAKLIREKHDVPVIYLTANADIGTIEAAKISLPYGYIIKPFTEKDLQTNIEIARFKFENDIQSKIESDQYNALFKKDQNLEGKIFIDGKDGLTKINLNDVYYIEEDKDSCKIHFRDDVIFIPGSMNDIEKKFPKEEFLRISDTAIININKVFLAKYPEIIIADKMTVLTADKARIEESSILFNN